MQPFWQWKSCKYCIFCVCVCSLRYPACSAHVPYYTGRFIMFSVITNIYNKKTKGPTLMDCS